MVADSVLTDKVQRHQRLVERKENISRNESEQVLLFLRLDPQSCAPEGISTQTATPSVCDSGVHTDISFPIMTSVIVANQYLKDYV